VLIVEASADCREVLRTALSRRGIATLATAALGEALRLVREHEPSVVVLDLEADQAQDAQVLAELDRQLSRRHASVVLLGPAGAGAPASQCVVAKPYHFAPLIHTIEALAKAA
jgi:DNA-binding response OmpR family regulator